MLYLQQSKTRASREQQTISLDPEADHRRCGNAFRRIDIKPIRQWRELRGGRSADSRLNHCANHHTHSQAAGEGDPPSGCLQTSRLEQLDIDAIGQSL